MLWQLDQTHASRPPLDDSARSSASRRDSPRWLDDHAIGGTASNLCSVRGYLSLIAALLRCLSAAIGLAGCISTFTYYSAWTLLTPFLPDSSPLLALFPFPREWAIRIPALVILVGLSFVGMLTGSVLVQTAKRNGATLRGGRRRRPGAKADKRD
ncbi:hypothetical protein BMF94_2203 [Rhodotorula taiwanensis]|uniref:Dolichol phosphate-mannose biosynthesis regulatory protein n=1 Tax=Rhodotorula taiwanensis TaxID=741276 RepID=A0A2S5BD84_9BASI|nr:hypothetical protein BMF94_2203 [Rhodotorula taiwanensis]